MPKVVMRSCAIVFLILSTASCASSSSTPNVSTPTQRTVAVDDARVYRTTVAANSKVPIPAAPNRTFDAVKVVYEELGVPPGTNDAASGRFGNTDFWKSRRFANEPMSSFLSCGESFTGPVANNYRIYISLMSQVRPDGKGGSELETAFSALAQNMEGSSGDRIPCGSTGKLEERIRKAVLLRIGASSP
jgi:hypothetical protein